MTSINPESKPIQPRIQSEPRISPSPGTPNPKQTNIESKPTWQKKQTDWHTLWGDEEINFVQIPKE